MPVPGRPKGPPQTGDYALYEAAEPSYDLTVPVGPNTFSVAAVAATTATARSASRTAGASRSVIPGSGWDMN